MNNIPKALEFYQEILGKLKMRRGMSKRDREFLVRIEKKIGELKKSVDRGRKILYIQ